MSEHAQGPLEVFERSIKTAHGRPGMDLSELIPVWIMNAGRCQEGNARRFVACWNACLDLSTEDLEALAYPSVYWPDRNKRLRSLGRLIALARKAKARIQTETKET